MSNAGVLKNFPVPPVTERPAPHVPVSRTSPEFRTESDASAKHFVSHGAGQTRNPTRDRQSVTAPGHGGEPAPSRPQLNGPGRR